MRDTALVVPSIRRDSFDRFVREWKPTGLFDRVDLVLIEDSPMRTFVTDSGTVRKHFSWEDIDRYAWSWIIPRRSDTVRSFGYWWAWSQGYDFLMTLDDDCYPAKDYEELDVLHRAMLERTKWFSTLNNVRPRGVPYRNLGSRPVHVNHGIWEGVLDYDAPQQLVNPIPETYTHDNRIVPHGAYHPFCGMNAMWRREAIPLSYHLLMGKMIGDLDSGGCPPQCNCFDVESALTPLPFDRFGDIWCGIIQKRICDHLGWVVSTGTPYIHHDRASDPFKNLRKEANGIEINEHLWKFVDRIELRGTGAAECYAEMGRAFNLYGGEHSTYWGELSEAMVTWAGLFED
jgi:reversibly glycosylated polypeptide/UDP-arabinopyranose mutase